MKNIPSYILVLIFVCLGGCIAVGESRPCGLAEDGKEIRCGVGYKCVRRWCVPQDWSFPDAGGREHKAKEERQESSSTKEEISKEQVPTEKEVPKESPSEKEVDTKQCAETCHLGDAKHCYSGKSGCTAGGTCQGVCQQGQQFCHLENGCPTWSICFDEITPVVEVCNNKDDDCDGQTDEALKRTCYDGKKGTEGRGICMTGEQVCTSGRWGACTGQQLPKTEVCNKADDNCDGQVDEGCKCIPGETRVCETSGIGACRDGIQTCSAQGQWGACTAELGPTTELCNGADDDCDGKTDEGCVTTLFQLPLQTYVIDGITVDRAGDLYAVVDHQIWKLIRTGHSILYAGLTVAGFRDGPALQARFDTPRDIVSDGKGNVYVVDSLNGCIRKIDPLGNVTTFVGSSGFGLQDGVGVQAQFRVPFGMVWDGKGVFYVAEVGNAAIRTFDISGNVTTYAGSRSGKSGFKDGPSAQALFFDPVRLTLDSSGNLYVADMGNHRIRKVDTAGNVTTFVGSGAKGFKNGPALQAELDEPVGVALDSKGNLYIAERQSYRIRKVDTLGNVTTFAGTGTKGSKNGPLLQSQFGLIRDLFIDNKDYLYVSDDGYQIRKIVLP